MPGEMIPIIFFVVTAYIIKVISDNGTKKRLIEKGMIDENLKYFYADKYDRYVPSALKWGMVLTAIGLAILVGRLLDEYRIEEITIGLMLLFGGLALVIYYFIARKMSEKLEKPEQS